MSVTKTPQELVAPDEFLSRLGQCFADPSSSGTVWLTHKRYTYHEPDDDVPMAESEPGAEHDVLLRCTHGAHSKFSTRISPSSLLEFNNRYGSLLKSSMAPRMRKRDKKRDKARTEAAVKKRRELYVDVVISNEGKRGKGRRQRMRKVAAQRKKEAERERVEGKDAERAKMKEGVGH